MNLFLTFHVLALGVGHHLNILDDGQLILIQIAAGRSAAEEEGDLRTCTFCRLFTAVRHR